MKEAGIKKSYGIRHSDKCSDKELKEFKKDVYEYLNQVRFINNKIVWKTIRVFNCFGGEVRVYTGKINERMPMKKRRRLIVFKDTNGQWKSNSIRSIQNIMSTIGKEVFNGSQVWQYHSEPIKEIDYFPVFRTEWYSEDKEIVEEERNQLKLKLRNLN